MDVYPILAQFLTNQEVVLQVETDGKVVDSATISVWKLEKQVHTYHLTNVTDNSIISLGVYPSTFDGYGVMAELIVGNEVVQANTAFDVVDDPRRSLRYGFVSDFQEKDRNNGAIEWMRKMHINLVQYYDWSFRHDNLVCQDQNYTDMMGKRISGVVVKEKIQKAKEFGMYSMAYGAVYAASKEFYDKHKSWGFYNVQGNPFVFIDTFYIMNISRHSPWRIHLYEQYLRSIQDFGFSGIHMDTYGFPKTAFSRLQEAQEKVRLDSEFPSLIDDARDFIQERGEKPILIFNNVGNWPVYATAPTSQDAVYIEVWDPYTSYSHIKQIILNAREYSKSNKPIILAAYLKPFRIGNREEALPAAKLLMAAIVSNGAYHLLLGENGAALTQGYYSDYSKLSINEMTDLRHYYDFMIRYMSLFYSPSLVDVSMTHFGGDNYEYRCTSHDISVSGTPGKIWATIRQGSGAKLISLINLCGCENDYWNEGKKKPIPQKNISFEIEVDDAVKAIYSTSPDSDLSMHMLQYSTEEKVTGKFVRFTLPEIEHWSLIMLKS